MLRCQPLIRKRRSVSEECRTLRNSHKLNEGKAVLHQGHLHALDDSTLIFKHLYCKFLNVSVSIVELLDVELVDDTDTQTLKEAWGIDLIVTNTFDVSDLTHLREVEAI